MRERLRERLRRMEERLQELDRALLDPAVASDPQQLRRLGQERAELEPVVALWRGHRALEEELAATEALMADPELRALAEEEKARLAERLAESEHALTEALTPRDPEDDRPAFLEIRAGTGGEEAALFAADLLRMYLRYAERRGWRSEILSASESDLGGYREVIVRLEARQRDEQAAAVAAARKSLVGSGDRSERIRTYNFPQGRVTDHRINLTLYQLDAVLEGDLDPLIEPLRLEYEQERLRELETEGEA